MAQKTVEGEEALLNVSAEERVTTTFIFTSRHFFLRLSDVALGKIVQMEKPDKQRKAFTKKGKARPSKRVEEPAPGPSWSAWGPGRDRDRVRLLSRLEGRREGETVLTLK